MRRAARARAEDREAATSGPCPSTAAAYARTRAYTHTRAAVLFAITCTATAALAGMGCSGHPGTAHARAAGTRGTTPSAKHPKAAEPLEPGGESREIRRLIALRKPVYCGGARGNEVALTFDDGPGPYTRLALRKLRAAGASATFFLVGRNLPLVADAARSERALGMVGDHTYDHPLLPSLSRAAAQTEIVRAQRAIERASGGPVFLFRPPYEAMDAAVAAIVHREGLLEILWDVDSEDSLRGNYARIAQRVIAGLRAGTIALMHENHGQTIRALPYIFAALHRRHLRAVSVPRLLTDDPPSLAQLSGGWSGCGLRVAPNGD